MSTTDEPRPVEGIVVPDETEELDAKDFRWNIEPHPYDSSFDVFVTDDDQEALAALLHAAEMHLWDGIEPGQERVLRVRYNK
jgi:hypothetical protein